MQKGDKVECIKDYLVRTTPKDYMVKVGEVVEIEGFIFGDPVFKTDKGSCLVSMDENGKEGTKRFFEHFVRVV